MVTGFFARPGQGKTSALAVLAYRALAEGRPVFSTQPIEGTIKLDFKGDLGTYDLPFGSLVLIDEIVLEADNRDYKSIPSQVKSWFVLHRHYGIDVIWASQYHNGVDKKIRAITDATYKLSVLSWKSIPIINFVFPFILRLLNFMYYSVCEIFGFWDDCISIFPILTTDFKIPYLVKARNYLFDIVYKQRDLSLEEGYIRPPGLWGMLIRLVSPVYRDKYYCVTPAIMGTFDTYDQPISYREKLWERWGRGVPVARPIPPIR